MSKINGNFFDDEENLSDVMSEQEAEALEQNEDPVEEQVQEEIIEQAANSMSSIDDEDAELENDQELVNSARLRLDQGRLYEMIIAHSFFDDVDANPKAVKNVQREIRNFAKERLEILLGLKPDPRLMPVKVVKDTTYGLSTLELDILKKFLSKASNGVTEKIKEPPPKTNTVPKITQPSAPAKVNTIKAISKPAVSAPAKPAQPQRMAQPQPQQKQAPVKAQKAMEDDPLDGPISSLTAEQLIQRNKRAAERQKALRVSSPRAQPMPPIEQQEMMLMTQMNSASPTIQRLVGLIKSSKANQYNEED